MGAIKAVAQQSEEDSGKDVFSTVLSAFAFAAKPSCCLQLIHIMSEKGFNPSSVSIIRL